MPVSTAESEKGISMKKKIILYLALLTLLLTACGARQQEVIPTEVETTAPTAETTAAPAEETEETLPQMEEATVLTDKTPAVLAFFNAGDKLDLAGSYDENYYAVKLHTGYGLVSKNLVRTEDAPAYVSWTGYALFHAAFYDNFWLTGKPTALNTNEKLEILEDLKTCYLVKWGENTGYMRQKDISKWPISGGNSGGSNGFVPQDGADIELKSNCSISLLSTFVTQDGEVSGTATVLADRVPVCLGWFERGDIVQMAADDSTKSKLPGYAAVSVQDQWVYVDEMLLKRPEQEDYPVWEGYSAWDGKGYSHYLLIGDPVKSLYTNFRVKVIADLGTSYLVEIPGEVFCMDKEKVSKTPFAVNPGGGNAGPEWSDPKMQEPGVRHSVSFKAFI